MKRTVVVGAGPAGIAAAVTLSRTRTRSVTLIDGGSRPDGLVVEMNATPARWLLRGDRTRSHYLGGTGVGGGALVNAGVLGPDRGPIAAVDSRAAELGPVGAALCAGILTARPVRLVDRGYPSVAHAFGLTAAVLADIDLRRATTAYRLRMEGRRVIGVDTDRGAFDADEVFVAAGAVRTPLLLGDSGIRPDGLGEGLCDHPALTVSVPLSPGETNEDETCGDETCGDGVRAGLGRPDVKISAVAPIGGAADGSEPTGLVFAVDRFAAEPGTMRRGLIVALMESGRSGRVARSSATGAPVIDLGPFVDTERFTQLWSQVVGLLAGTALAELLADATIDEWGTRPADVDAPDTFAASLPGAIGGLYHAAGTCARVVEPGGVVRGYDNLYVADISQLRHAPTWPMVASIECGRTTAAYAVASDGASEGAG